MLLHVAAVLRVAFAATLDLPGRVAVLGVHLGPIAYAVFDNPVFGFHPELCYPPLCVLLALDLREGRSRRAIVVAALTLLVKEDGAVLCACVLVAYFARASSSSAPHHPRSGVPWWRRRPGACWPSPWPSGPGWRCSG